MGLNVRVVRPGLVTCCSVVYKGQCLIAQWRDIVPPAAKVSDVYRRVHGLVSHHSSIVSRYESLFCAQCLDGLMFITQRYVRDLGAGFGGEVTLASNRGILVTDT
jgi:hypothetical protein